MIGPLAILQRLPSGTELRVEMSWTAVGRRWQVFQGPRSRPCLVINEK